MDERLNGILALIPQSKDRELVLKEALYFQQTLGIRLFVLNVVKAPFHSLQYFRSKKLESLKNRATQDLSVFVKTVLKTEIPKDIILRIKTGDVVSTLIKESKTGGYGFIIIDKNNDTFEGAMHKRRINKFISKSYCPVLAVNKNFPVRDIKKIVIPIDISQSTKKRLLWAIFFAKKFNAQISIVSALNVNIDERKSLAYKNAEKIERLLLNRGIDCTVKILKVHKREKIKAILAFIEEENPELVILRTHQEYVFSGKNIGKFVSEIVHGCKMPVFTVNYSQKPF